MSDGKTSAVQGLKNLGWRVTLAGMGINLALGILYTWSVISKEIPAEWNWTQTNKSWPYSIACLVFALVMIPAGRMQDRIGPRIVATLGGLLVGIGMIVASMTTSPMGYILGFGVLAGAGIGFGYASATPPAVKWFVPARTGMIAGIVVSGFGLAPVYAAPLTKWLIGAYGLPTTVMLLGIAFLVIVVGLAQLVAAPPKGYVPVQAAPASAAAKTARPKAVDYTPTQMLATGPFYLLRFMYQCGAGAGLMVIGKLADIGKLQAGLENGFYLVAAMAVGNGAGRILTGMASDKFGRQRTLFGCFVVQTAFMLLLSRATKDSPLASMSVLAAISAVIGANYGANLALFPSITKDYYGLKNFGVNYGLMFTAWGVAGFVFPLLSGRLHDTYHTFAYSFYVAAILLAVAAVATFLVRSPHAATEPAPVPQPAVEPSGN
ncbi:MAG: L-lactate MFS transporter [Thermoguttaceae bacterium]